MIQSIYVTTLKNQDDKLNKIKIELKFDEVQMLLMSFIIEINEVA